MLGGEERGEDDASALARASARSAGASRRCGANYPRRAPLKWLSPAAPGRRRRKPSPTVAVATEPSLKFRRSLPLQKMSSKPRSPRVFPAPRPRCRCAAAESAAASAPAAPGPARPVRAWTSRAPRVERRVARTPARARRTEPLPGDAGPAGQRASPRRASRRSMPTPSVAAPALPAPPRAHGCGWLRFASAALIGLDSAQSWH